MKDFDFDFGDEGLSTNPWYVDSFPSKGQKTLLLDADFIPYTVGFCSKGEEMSRMDYLGHACFLIKDAMQKTGTDSVVLFFTGEGNFRYDVCENYKGQRMTEKPRYFDEVREWLLSLDCSVVSKGCEADDLISITAYDYYFRENQLFKKIIIGSKDKDLNQVVGEHVDLVTGEHYYVSVMGTLDPVYKETTKTAYLDCPLYKGEPKSPQWFRNHTDKTPDTYQRGANKGKVKYKRVQDGIKQSKVIKKLNGTGLRFFYAQLLMGDAVDNYHGIPKMGAAKTYELLKGCMTERELFDTAKRVYRATYGRKWREEMTKTGRLAWMQQYHGQMWEIPFDDKEAD